MRFKNGRPDRSFVGGFSHRNNDRYNYFYASPQESQSFSVTIAAMLNQYFANMEHTVQENNIDNQIICHLDESGFTQNSDQKRAQNPKTIAERG